MLHARAKTAIMRWEVSSVSVIRKGSLKGALGAAALALLLGLVALWPQERPVGARRDGLAMNTVIRLRVEGLPSAEAEAALDWAFGLLTSLDHELSIYDEGSDLSRVNRSAGGSPVTVPPDVFAAVSRAAEACRTTEGVFNPLIGPVTKLWRINRRQADPESQAFALPQQASLDALLPLTDPEGLELLPGPPPAIRLKRAGAVLDLSGIAKGYASARIAEGLSRRGVPAALIDLGGNVQLLGDRNGSPWNIGIRDPLSDGGGPLLALAVRDTAVITSGAYERYKVIDGVRYSHFFDPRTGRPVRNDMLSATLVTPDGALGDALATSFMIMGSARSMEFLRAHPELGAVLVRRRGGLAVEEGLTLRDVEVLVTENLRRCVRESRAAVQYF